MSNRLLVSRELANFVAALSHPRRLRIVLELQEKELDVNSLQIRLGTTHSAVSQSLAILRGRRIVRERREGRHVFYSLVDRRLAAWLIEALSFLERQPQDLLELREALASAQKEWADEQAARTAATRGA